MSDPRMLGVAAILTAAFSVATPLALLHARPSVERLAELGLFFAAWSSFAAYWSRELALCIAVLAVLAATSWAAAHIPSRIRTVPLTKLLWRVGIVLAAFEAYRYGLAPTLTGSPSGWSELPLDLVAGVILAVAVLRPRRVARGLARWARRLSSGILGGPGRLAWLGAVLAGLWVVVQVPVLLRGFRPGDPDVVWIVLDGVSADQVGPRADGESLTPALDAFAEEAIGFRWAWAQTSATPASLGSQLASRHPAAFGWGEADSRDHSAYLSDLLNQRGYRTEAIISDPEVAGIPGLAESFHRFDTELVRHYGDGASADEVSRRGLEVLRRSRARRLFLLLDYSDPELPLLASPGLRDELSYTGPLSSSDSVETLRIYAPRMKAADRAYLRAAQGEELLRTDAAISRVLKELGDEVLVVITSTHGSSRFARGPADLEARQLVFAEMVHVPLLVRVPGIAGGRTVTHAVQLTDLVPTLVERMGLHVPGGQKFAGRAIPLGHLDEFERLGPVPMYSETRFGADRWQAVNLGRWSYVRNLHGFEHMLFDLESDPGQTENRAAQQPERVAALGRLLDGWLWDARPEDLWPLASPSVSVSTPAVGAR